MMTATMTLSDYRALVLGILGDPSGRRYSNDTVDLALKEALAELQRYIPDEAGYTIRNLDNAGDTTVDDEDSIMLSKGAAGFAMEIRARSVTEVFGKRPEDTERLIEQAGILKAQFETEFAAASLQKSLNADPWPVKGWAERGLC